jgi:hypothetical protein
MTDWQKVYSRFLRKHNRRESNNQYKLYNVSPAFLLLHVLDFLIRCMQVTFDIKYRKLYITSNDIWPIFKHCVGISGYYICIP